MTLSNNQQNDLALATRSSIENAISRLKTHWTAQSWLPLRNRYRVEAANKVEADSQNNDSFYHSQLVDYVAASVLGHCYDGWSFLARALEAEMTGDPDAARHLGYYAELRAAMSILAGEGIGVFNRCHAVVLANGRCRSIGRLSTHQFTWEALEHWATLPASSKTLFEAIRPAGISLLNWITAFGGGAHFLAYSWLKQWGLDLSRLVKDRDARNLASYRPTAFTSPGPRPINKVVNEVTQLWSLCSPGSPGEFSTMDRHLLRLVLKMLFRSRTNRSPRQASRMYETQVVNMLNAQTLAGPQRDRLSELLLYEKESETPELLLSAARTDRPSHINHSRQVLARATLLLRVATGSLANLLDDSNTTFRTDLSFWWSERSVRRRLWAKNGVPETFGDLWEELQQAVETVLEWDPAEPDCGNSFWSEHSQSAALLTTPERIFLWGVSP